MVSRSSGGCLDAAAVGLDRVSDPRVVGRAAGSRAQGCCRVPQVTGGGWRMSGRHHAAVALLAALFGTFRCRRDAGQQPCTPRSWVFAVSVTAMAWRAQMGRQVFERAWHLVRLAVGPFAVLTAGAGAVLAASFCSHSTTSDALGRRSAPVSSVAWRCSWPGWDICPPR